MIETLLIDDEELPRRELRQILSGEADINIVGEASNGLQAVERITEIRPKLVFLDIEMPGLNGFEVVNSLGYLPFVVFVTAYDQYAIQAFEMNAVDYLIKRTISELEQSLEGEGFFRINRSSLVNLEYLAEIIPWFSGTCKLKLADGRELPLSRERVPRLKELVGILKHGSGA